MRRISIANTMVAILFVVALFIPLAGLIHPGLNIGLELEEKRAKFQRPALDRLNLTSFPDMYEKYFNDNFGFRSFLIRWNNYHRFQFFGLCWECSIRCPVAALPLPSETEPSHRHARE